MTDWLAIASQRQERYRKGEARVDAIADPDARQRQLTRMGNVAAAAGLALLMAGRPGDAGEWLRRAAERYRESWSGAPPRSWGRPIGALKALVLAGDWSGAEQTAAWPLRAGAADSGSAIGRYAACLALLVLGRDAEAGELAVTLPGHDDFPRPVAVALVAIAAADRTGYEAAIDGVLESFERREDHLEDVPVADTVLVLQALARRRGLAADLRASPLLPG